MESGYKNHKYSLKNILAAGLLSIPLLFSSCSREVQPTENYSGTSIVAEQQKETTSKYQSKLEQKLKQAHFHEDLSNEEYELLNQKYGISSKSITRKLEDPNFAMYSKLENIETYSDIQKNPNTNRKEFVWYFVLDNNIVEFVKREITKEDEYPSIFLEILKAEAGSIINLANDKMFSIGYRTQKMDINNFSQDFGGTYDLILDNLKFVRFSEPTNPATINDEGKIISPDLKILGQVSKRDFEYFNNILKHF